MPDTITDFTDAGEALSAHPEPVAVVDVTEDAITTRATNDAFTERFDAPPSEIVPRSFAAATDGSAADGGAAAETDEPAVSNGTITAQSGAREQPFRVRYVEIEEVAEADTESRTVRERGYLLWSPSPADRRGKERFVELHGTTRRMVTAESRTEVAEIAANAVGNVIEFPLNTVRLYDPETERLQPTAVSDATREVTPGERPAYDEDEFLVYQDITEIDDDVERSGEGSMLVAPLADHGVLTMGTTEPEAITDTDIELARVFAANVEVAMDRIERITALRERERELERQNERLDRFASVLSHDLRNPISIASGYAEVAQREAESDEVAEYTEEILDAVERMSTLVEQTLTLAREGDTVEETELVCVPELARRLTDTVTGQSPTLDFPAGDGDEPPGWTVEGDAKRIERILENLLRNADEHSDGSVTVRIGRLDDEGFYVADDGPGIPPEKRDSVFEYGTSYDDGGTGLGLAIVSELTQAHGWAVELTDSWAGGARFEFRTDPESPATENPDPEDESVVGVER
ncbi:MAG: sensor histidine kinase [Halobaculum sp.]